MRLTCRRKNYWSPLNCRSNEKTPRISSSNSLGDTAITPSPAWQRKRWHRFRPQEAYALHLHSRSIVQCELAAPHVGPTICVFHHAVIPEAVGTARRDLLDAAYASDLTALFESFPCELVVTGHVHRSFDVRRGGTRFLANPVGYAGENASFDPALVVEVPNG